MSSLAVCPGSFDPVTLGHMDVIRRAAALFDRVVVVVMVNSSKRPAFTVEERVRFLRKATAVMPNVSVESYAGLLADYAEKKDATTVKASVIKKNASFFTSGKHFEPIRFAVFVTSVGNIAS